MNYVARPKSRKFNITEPVFCSRLKTHLFSRSFRWLYCCACEVTLVITDTLIAVLTNLLTKYNVTELLFNIYMFLSSGKKLRVKPHAYSDTWVSPGFTFISDVSFAGGRLSFWMAAAQMQTMHSFQCVSTTPSYLASIRPGARFSKNLTTNLWKTYEKARLTKNLGWACDFQKILWKT